MPPQNHYEPTDTLDQVYKALSHPARRRLLLAIQEENPRTLEEIAAMQTWPERQKQEAIVTLHHTHLPHLANNGFIKWDPESNTVKKGPQFAELCPHLKVLRERL